MEKLPEFCETPQYEIALCLPGKIAWEKEIGSYPCGINTIYRWFESQAALPGAMRGVGQSLLLQNASASQANISTSSEPAEREGQAEVSKSSAPAKCSGQPGQHPKIPPRQHNAMTSHADMSISSPSATRKGQPRKHPNSPSPQNARAKPKFQRPPPPRKGGNQGRLSTSSSPADCEGGPATQCPSPLAKRKGQSGRNLNILLTRKMQGPSRPASQYPSPPAKYNDQPGHVNTLLSRRKEGPSRNLIIFLTRKMHGFSRNLDILRAGRVLGPGGPESQYLSPPG